MNKLFTNAILANVSDEIIEVGATVGDTQVMKMVPMVTEVVEAKPTATTTTTTKNKKELASEMFTQHLGAQRKVVIGAMMEYANLSKNGASTYYQNFKSGKWVV